MNHTPALEFSRSGSAAPDLEAQPILESSCINDLDQLPGIWADRTPDSAILRISWQIQEVNLRSRSGGLITPYYVGGSSAPLGRGAFPPHVGGRLALRWAGRRRPSDPTATNVELNQQPGRLSMAATTLPEPGRVPAAPQLRLQHQVILALDLGQTTGWAVRNADGVITHGTVQFRPGRHEGGGMPFLRFRAWLQELDETVDGIDAVFFEEVRGHRGTTAAQVFGGFLAHLTAWAEMNKIPYEGVPVGTIKRHITGKGNAMKEEVIAAIRAKGFSPVDDNDADALALLDWAIANRFGGGGQ